MSGPELLLHVAHPLFSKQMLTSSGESYVLHIKRAHNRTCLVNHRKDLAGKM